jgi:PelA/Pel-15E family pectate lyase
MTNFLLLFVAFHLSVIEMTAQTQPPRAPLEPIDLSKFDDDIRHWAEGEGFHKIYDRYEPSEIVGIADNIIGLQNADGGWPKNVDWLAKIDRDTILKSLSSLEKRSTCDNRNTYSQIEYLSKVFTQTRIDRFRVSADRGISFLLATQHKSGGWRGADVDAITFNDDLMSGVMNLFLDMQEGMLHYSWMTHERRASIIVALDKAISATLRCQIVVNGKRTGWCQQHDHITFAPAKARSYELPSLAALETSSVVEFLMRLKHPSTAVQAAIKGAITWLRDARLMGIRLEKIQLDGTVSTRLRKRHDVRVREDETAPPIWARYYEIDTNRPFFANRDGIKVYSLAEVNVERRMGYAWYGDWPAELLDRKYPHWLRQIEIIRDTSFTLSSAFAKEKKNFPHIEPVLPRQRETVYEIRDRVYASPGGRDLMADIFIPMKDTSTTKPALILIHGGGWRSGSKEMEHPMAQRMAELGYVAVTVEYRLSLEAQYLAALHDIKAAIRWVKINGNQFGIDTNKIALYGTSAGGQLAALVGITGNNRQFDGYSANLAASPSVRAIVDVDGVLDMTHPAESGKDTTKNKPSVGKKWFGASFKERPDLWREASPLNHVTASSPPILFINSSIDRFHAGRDEVRAQLGSFGIYSELHTIPNTPHPFWLFHPWFEKVVEYTATFLEKVFLKQQTK